MPASEHRILIGPAGEIQFVWADELAPILSVGLGRIRRASHVEPTADARWQADLSPVGGPILGPFELRGDALRAELQWLEKEMLSGGAIHV